MTELALIALIRRLAGKPDGRLFAGIGDDCAIWQPRPGCQLLFTTDQADKLFLIGTHGGRLSVVERSFPRPMGLDVSADGATVVETLAELPAALGVRGPR